MSSRDSGGKGLSAGKRSAVIVLAFFGLTFIAYALGFDPSVLHNWTDNLYLALNPFRFLLLALRWAVFIALWWYWPEIVARWFPDSLSGYQARRDVMMGMRHRIFIVLAVLELCLQFARL
jgi:hypothetical protein